MDNFTFNAPTLYKFGRETYLKTGELLKKFGAKNILIVIGQGKAVGGGLLETVISTIEKEGIRYEILKGVLPNPQDDKVYEGIDISKKKKIDFILAVGGGSVIDTAKAIAFGSLQDGDFWDFYVHKQDCKNSIPLGCVLTIAAAGSEGSASSVITKKSINRKSSYGHPSLSPKFAVLSPELTCKLPSYPTSCGVVDIFAHAMERYFTTTEDNVITDKLCESIMSSALEIGLMLTEKPEDYQLRANLMWTGTLAHNNFCGCGRTQDWSSHDISHRLSALYDTAHGAALSVIIPAWMEYVAATDNYKRVCRLGVKVLALEKGIMTDKEFAHYTIKELKNTFKRLKMPVSFSDIGARTEDINKMLEGIDYKSGGSLGAFKVIYQEDIEKIYRIAARI